jgi:ribonuclease J
MLWDKPKNSIVHTGDFKLDPRAHISNRTDLEAIQRLGSKNILALLCDSTNSYAPGHQVSEEEVEKNVELMFSQTQGRMIVATFASLLSRVQQVLTAAEKFNRKVLVEGYSMKTNIEIGKKLGYIRVKPNTILPWEEIKKLPNNRYLILCTGAQGEDNAVLMRIANREHKYLTIERGDLVVFSSSVIPGNDRAVTRLKDGLLREGADIVDSKMLDIHAGGHGKQGDIADLIKMVKPKYFIPIEGSFYNQFENKKIAVANGIPDKNVIMADNGQVIEFANGQGYVTNYRIPIEYIFVDGSAIGDVNALVLRDRKQLAGDGMIVVVAQVSGRTGKVGKIDIISRGLTHMKEQGTLIHDMVGVVHGALKSHDPKMKPQEKDLREQVRRDLEKYIFQKIQRQPMIIPVIVEA